MTMRLVAAVCLVAGTVSFSGCRCPMQSACSKTCCKTTPEPALPEIKVISVKIDADQNFVCDGKKLTVEEFFKQAEFNQDSKTVYFDVDQQSAIAEETVMKAIRYLESNGYIVSMVKTSKYAHLSALCKK